MEEEKGSKGNKCCPTEHLAEKRKQRPGLLSKLQKNWRSWTPKLQRKRRKSKRRPSSKMHLLLPYQKMWPLSHMQVVKWCFRCCKHWIEERSLLLQRLDSHILCFSPSDSCCNWNCSKMHHGNYPSMWHSSSIHEWSSSHHMSSTKHRKLAHCTVDWFKTSATDGLEFFCFSFSSSCCSW